MEPASSTHGMPLPEKLRPKQREIIEAFALCDHLVAKLPTGYGKTLAAAGAYAMLRHRHACNRVLYIVPRAGQAKQAAESMPAELAHFGIQTRSVEVGTSIPALRAHREGRAEVFVTTIQGLLHDATWKTATQLMETGRWLVVVDEHHHYGVEGAWVERLKALPGAAQLAMSATPNRPDGSDHFPDPDVSETYVGAWKQGCVKELLLHAYEYVVDAVLVDGATQALTLTTEEIAQQAGGDSPEAIDQWLLARKMRWSPKYISPLITFPLDRLIDLRARGIRSQMLVQAMSCSHAKMVTEQIKALIPDYMTVDWVGTGPSGRADVENIAVLSRFCPPKDVSGRRPWALDILVNVGMAGEGLDTTDVTEVVFLTPANVTTTNLQTIGRGARLIPGLGKSQPPCHVNVDTASPMAELVGREIMGVFDGEPPDDPFDEPADSRERDAQDYDPLPERMSAVIVDVRLQDIRKGALWEAALAGAREAANTATPPEVVERAAEQAIIRHLSRGSNISSTLAQKREQVNSAVSKIAGLVVRRVREATGVRVEKSFAGDLRRRINGQKKRVFGVAVDAATEDQLDEQWAWLRDLEKQILLGHAMQGVPTWLR